VFAVRVRFRAYCRGDAGVTTAEYAVCTLGGVALAGVLLKVLTSEKIQLALSNLIGGALA